MICKPCHEKITNRWHCFSFFQRWPHEVFERVYRLLKIGGSFGGKLNWFFFLNDAALITGTIFLCTGSIFIVGFWNNNLESCVGGWVWCWLIVHMFMTLSASGQTVERNDVGSIQAPTLPIHPNRTVTQKDNFSQYHHYLQSVWNYYLHLQKTNGPF